MKIFHILMIVFFLIFNSCDMKPAYCNPNSEIFHWSRNQWIGECVQHTSKDELQCSSSLQQICNSWNKE